MEFPAPFVKVVMHSRDPETGETKIINPDEEN